MSNLNKILDLILEESKKETHPDNVTGLHAVLMKVNIEVGKKMEEMRNGER